MVLKIMNRHERDACIKFYPENHTYVITRGEYEEVAPVSVTSFCKDYFTQFDPRKVVDQNYDKWKSNPNSKYFANIQASLKEGLTEEMAKQAIIDTWASVGREASAAGTDMHARAELYFNGVGVMHADDREMHMLQAWFKVESMKGWREYRTEMPLWWDEPRLDGRITVAGTLDFLMVRETQVPSETDVESTVAGKEYALVDFKRTNPARKYKGGPPNLLGPSTGSWFAPGFAKAPLTEVEDSKYGAYCMQLNVLAKMLRERYGIDVGNRMYLLQIHKDMNEAHCIRVPEYREATNALFAIEAEKRRIQDEKRDKKHKH